MSDHECNPDDLSDPSNVQFPGPFSSHDVVVTGWKVPLLSAHVEGDKIMLVLDHRLALTLTVAEAETVVPFIADAIAVAQGFGAHPRGDMEHPYPLPPNGPRRVHDILGFDDGEVAER